MRAVVAEACARVPEEWEVEGPGISLSLGDAADLDPALLEAMLGPLELTGRLPRTCAALADGTISADRADTVAAATVFLSDADAAPMDEILAAAAPGLRVDQLARKAAALEMKLDPEAVRIRKEHARSTRQRVEVRRELSGNASLSGRELDTAQALASKAHIDAVAVKLRNDGGLEGSLSSIRARVLIELTQGRDPLNLIGPLRPGAPAPLPASINLLIPIGTYLGWSSTPAQANGIGLVDPTETQAIVQAASHHPRTRWCATIVDDDGTAIAHACARGQRPQTPATNAGAAPPGAPPPTSADGPNPSQSGEAPDAAQRARLGELLTQLKLAPERIARGQCDHRQAEDQYVPSRKLKHVLRARTATCDAPGCNAQAVYCDQDHTTPWPDGPTDQCNLGPKCRRHHRYKQAPGWQVEQPEPGIVRWTLPNARTHHQAHRLRPLTSG